MCTTNDCIIATAAGAFHKARRSATVTTSLPPNLAAPVLQLEALPAA